MSDIELSIRRLRAAITGADFEWEVNGGSPFDDVAVLLAAYDDVRNQLGKARGDAIQECIDLCNELSNCSPGYIASRMLDLSLSDEH